MLLLDTGDALVGGGTLGDATQGEAIVAAMNQVGYDVMALGTRELGLGADVLRARIAEAEFPVVSANVAADDGRELVKPYALLDVGGHRVGVIGLTREPAEKISGFEVTDPSAALATWLPELAQAANTIVVLTNLDLEQAKAVAGGAAGVNLVVAANPLRVPMQAERLTDTNALLVAAEKPAPRHTGRRVGRLSATLQSDGSLSDDSWESIWLEKTLPDDPAMTTLLESFE